MECFTLAEIDLAKRCFRVFRVMAKDEEDARCLLPDGASVVGCLGSEPTTAKKKSCKAHLVRTREQWTTICAKFGLTAEQGERTMGQIYVPPK